MVHVPSKEHILKADRAALLPLLWPRPKAQYAPWMHTRPHRCIVNDPSRERTLDIEPQES